MLITKILKPASFLACSLILFSCEKEHAAFPLQEKASSNTTELIEKIETAYVEGPLKDETTPTTQLETRATDEYLLNLQNKIDTYFQKFESRYRVAAEYDGYSVGVVPNTDNCGTEERIRYFMDNQDGGGTIALGWTGAWSWESETR